MTFRYLCVLVLLLLYPAQGYADTGCLKNPRNCLTAPLCFYSSYTIKNSKPVQRAWSKGSRWAGHVREAKRRGLSCGVKNAPSFTKIQSLYRMFSSLSKTERKQLQTKLKSIGAYKSSIDGLYGKNTQNALKKYINDDLNLEKINDATTTLAFDALLDRKAETKPLEKETQTATLKEEVEPVETAEQQSSNELETKPLEITEELIAQRLSEGDLQSAVLAAKILAPKGNGPAQFVLGSAYAEGVGVLQQFKLAHMWLNIASLNGANEAVEARNELQTKMTPDAVMEAQELALKCIQSTYTNCGELPSSTTTEVVAQAQTEPIQIEAVKQAFTSSSTLRRKQIQYALKEMGLYASSIDAKWGSGTERGFENYLKLSEQDFTSAQDMVENLLSKVDAPTSFTAKISKKVKTVTKVAPKLSVKKPNFRSPSGWRSFANVSVSFEQADAICRPQARNAGRGAKAPSMYGSNITSCNQFGSSITCNSGDLSGFQGFANAMASLGAEKNAYNGCMAQYGWKRTKKQGLFER